MAQMGLDFRTWGGRRAGAGRKKSGRAGVPHRRRVGFAHRTPVHVTLRTLPHVWNLRSRRALRAMEGALLQAAQADGARLVQFSVQANHVHLLIEAIHTAALTGRMRSLGIAIARRLNALMGRRGKVLADRYHEHVLRTPTEVRRAVHDLRNQQPHHHPDISFSDGYQDPFTSEAPARARTWLVK